MAIIMAIIIEGRTIQVVTTTDQATITLNRNSIMGDNLRGMADTWKDLICLIQMVLKIIIIIRVRTTLMKIVVIRIIAMVKTITMECR
jgi:hypothetical protein